MTTTTATVTQADRALLPHLIVKLDDWSLSIDGDEITLLNEAGDQIGYAKLPESAFRPLASTSGAVPEGSVLVPQWIPASQALPRHRYMGAFKSPSSRTWAIVGPGSFRAGIFHDSLGEWPAVQMAFHLPPVDAMLAAAPAAPPPSEGSVLREAIARVKVAWRAVLRSHGRAFGDVDRGYDTTIVEMRDAVTALAASPSTPSPSDQVERMEAEIFGLRDALKSVQLEIGPAKAYAEECGLEAKPLPSAVHIKLDLINGYCRAALESSHNG